MAIEAVWLLGQIVQRPEARRKEEAPVSRIGAALKVSSGFDGQEPLGACC
jgi:hypothetical protein